MQTWNDADPLPTPKCFHFLLILRCRRFVRGQESRLVVHLAKERWWWQLDRMGKGTVGWSFGHALISQVPQLRHWEAAYRIITDWFGMICCLEKSPKMICVKEWYEHEIEHDWKKSLPQWPFSSTSLGVSFASISCHFRQLVSDPARLRHVDHPFHHHSGGFLLHGHQNWPFRLRCLKAKTAAWRSAS